MAGLIRVPKGLECNSALTLDAQLRVLAWQQGSSKQLAELQHPRLLEVVRDVPDPVYGP